MVHPTINPTYLYNLVVGTRFVVGGAYRMNIIALINFLINSIEFYSFRISLVCFYCNSKRRWLKFSCV